MLPKNRSLLFAEIDPLHGHLIVFYFLIMALKNINPHLRLGTITFSIDIGIILIGGLLFRDFDGIIHGKGFRVL